MEVYAQFKDLNGKIFTKIDVIEDYEIRFYEENGNYYKMFHEQDCCERVEISDINGDIHLLENTPILLAEKVVSNPDCKECTRRSEDCWDDSCTWTFYKLATIKEYIDIRWIGASNGYYSENVDLVYVTKE